MGWLLFILGVCIYLLIGVFTLGYTKGRTYNNGGDSFELFIILLWPITLLVFLAIEICCYGPIHKMYKFCERLGEKVRMKREEEEE